MATNGQMKQLIDVSFDREEDTLIFSFSETPHPAVAEETADDVWVRYDVATTQVVSVEVLNFSRRIHNAFGPQLIYTERVDPERVSALAVFDSPDSE